MAVVRAAMAGVPALVADTRATRDLSDGIAMMPRWRRGRVIMLIAWAAGVLATRLAEAKGQEFVDAILDELAGR